MKHLRNTVLALDTVCDGKNWYERNCVQSTRMRHWAALRQPVTAVVLGGARGKESEGKPGTMALERCQSEWNEIEKEYQQLQVRGCLC